TPSVIHWIWTTGRSGRIYLESDAPGWETWISESLSRAYREAEWVPDFEPAPSTVDRELGYGEPYPDALAPFPSVSDESPPWIESVIPLLRSAGSGWRFHWQLEALGPSTASFDPGGSEALLPQPPGWRLSAPPRAARDRSDRLEERRQGARWTVRLTVSGRTDLGNGGAGRRLLDAIEGASKRDGGGGFRIRPRRSVFGGGPSVTWLSEAEVAMLFPRPSCPLDAGIDRGPGHGVPLAIGRSSERDPGILWMPRSEGRHLLVLGETGTGKTNLLLRLALQAQASAGVLLFDPLGDTARRFLERLPASAADRVMYLSPTRSPVGVNALAPIHPIGPSPPGGRDRSLLDLVGVLRRVRVARFADTPFWGPRIEEVVELALRAASALPNGTLLEAERLLSQPDRRPRGIPAEATEAVGALRDRVLEHPEEVEGARRLLGEVGRNAVLRSILCRAEAASSVSGWVARDRIAVISGEAQEVGESTARYLLSVLFALAWSALLARPTAPKTVLVLDEAQWYAHEAAAEILRLGRRMNVHLWMATQAIASLPEEVQEAAKTNASDFVLFRGSPDDAREIHRWVPSVAEEELLGLPRGHALYLRGKGERIRWVSVPDPPPVRGANLRLEEVLDVARAFWPREAEDAPAPLRPGAPLDPGLRSFLLVLWAGASVRAPDEPMILALEPLRRTLDPGGTLVRAAGTLLSRVGALGPLREGPDGRVWELRKGALETVFDGGIDAGEWTLATARWREVEGEVVRTSQ
ncbi:MAG TPA: DUF87 domain-containing protein, partial [Thermoplasmata archaeon]|nr:DUF87 domain-containing protein [Thermoplasmata archaeon]